MVEVESHLSLIEQEDLSSAQGVWRLYGTQSCLTFQLLWTLGQKSLWFLEAPMYMVKKIYLKYRYNSQIGLWTDVCFSVGNFEPVNKYNVVSFTAESIVGRVVLRVCSSLDCQGCSQWGNAIIE